ncbi:MAG TPA: magnesium transporter [Solirubrobacterales bacterium]|nr:magnesium transporter [Solirubrobacterales bacterium]
MEGRSPARAEDLVTSRVPVASPEDSVGSVRDLLAGNAYDSVADVAVLREGELAGIVAIEALLEADAASRMADVLDSDAAAIHPAATDEVAASVIAERGGRSLPVVGEDGRFLGLIPPKGMLAVLLEEHEEDLARIGGYRAGTGRARQAARESVLRRLGHRLPWLLVGAAGAMLSAVLLGAFEDELDRKVVIAFFVPAVVYLANAVGTQTQTILIRGLSVGVTVRQVASRELLTGTLAGALVAVAFAPFALVAFGDADVALALALALLASCTAATVIAMALPWVFQRFGADPAFGSGPLATVLQDLISLVIYLAIAIPLAA